MPRNPDINSKRSPRIGRLRRGLALVAAALALVPAAAVAQTPRAGPAQSTASGQAASAAAPTTVVRETVVRPTNGNPPLPIVLSATALAVALAAGAHTLVHGTARHHGTRA